MQLRKAIISVIQGHARQFLQTLQEVDGGDYHKANLNKIAQMSMDDFLDNFDGSISWADAVLEAAEHFMWHDCGLVY